MCLQYRQFCRLRQLLRPFPLACQRDLVFRRQGAFPCQRGITQGFTFACRGLGSGQGRIALTLDLVQSCLLGSILPGNGRDGDRLRHR